MLRSAHSSRATRFSIVIWNLSCSTLTQNWCCRIQTRTQATASRGSSSAQPNNPTASQVWDAFTRAWALVYIGMSEIITTDRGTQCTSQEFQLALIYRGVEQSLDEYIRRPEPITPKCHRTWSFCTRRRPSTRPPNRMDLSLFCWYTDQCRAVIFQG